MEHEVYLPLSATAVRSAFAEPERVARCVPGLRLEPDGGLAGRLKVRIGSSTITYRGTLTLTERGEGLTIEAVGGEVRGEGAARLVLTVVPRPVADRPGCTLSFAGTVEAGGRLVEYAADQRAAAGRRLLDRFAETLVEELATAMEAVDVRDALETVDPVDTEEPPPTALAAGIGAPGDNEPAIPVIPAAPEPEPGLGPSTEPSSESASEGEAELWAADLGELGDPAGAEAGEEIEVADDLVAAGVAVPEPEADFARRTMIGRSAEEVDHAPPRGRYAPDPAPGQPTGAAVVLRWAAPAAAIALASVVIVGRALRRRRAALR
ncbi:carbon monoxide dehydrogenase subunit G [Streptomyces hainanensis]|uniref:Carbon monoxide dehydrogenase subunit G n=2 Tax=Streptomyces hainanensis TaxID=402648 RepID=A0A4R4TPS2_9ACTN|nr:carbon monoxide dehydrogenase subunit G [Streptomyces hainanensis]TDC79920.1 carbon monoxide dehydrogenase subunit G [Streptomyces hainanensis]